MLMFICIVLFASYLLITSTALIMSSASIVNATTLLSAAAASTTSTASSPTNLFEPSDLFRSSVVSQTSKFVHNGVASKISARRHLPVFRGGEVKMPTDAGTLRALLRGSEEQYANRALLGEAVKISRRASVIFTVSSYQLNDPDTFSWLPLHSFLFSRP